MKALLTLLLFIVTTAIHAQQIIICGHIKDKESKVVFSNTNIRYKGSNYSSDSKGYYAINVTFTQLVTLKFTHVGYNSYIRSFTEKEINVKKDTLFLDILMTSTVIELDPIGIDAVQKPDRVIGNNAFFIQDFEFSGNYLVLLTTDRSSDVWSVQLAKEDQAILSKFIIPVTDVLQLYKDFLGYVNVICKEEVYRVKIDGESIRLQQLPKNDFDWMIRPCVDTIQHDIYFSNYSDAYPRFSYFSYNKNDSTKVLVRSVVDKDLELQYEFEYEFLKPKEKLMARKIAQQNGFDKHDVAAVMTDFAHTKWFTPLYAPMFIVRDTVLIFDHYSDKIYKYDSKNKLIDSIKISYHHPEKFREWRRQLLKDETSSLIYGMFLKGGYTYLKGININSGNIESISRLSFQFVEKARIKDGYGY